MHYQGQAICVTHTQDDILLMTLDLAQESVNKFNQATLTELQAALDHIQQYLSTTQTAYALVIVSNKPSFVVGADIGEFLHWFANSDDHLHQVISRANAIFNQLEDLPIPTLAAINGQALGGGLEFCLACDYRIASTCARLGLPEVKLGIFPGFGGTVRLPRLIGADNALEWICRGSEYTAESARDAGVVDAVVATEQLHSSALTLAKRILSEGWPVQPRRQEKQRPLQLNAIESMMAFETAKAYVKSQAGPHYPAPLAAVKTVQKHAHLSRDEALAIETAQFIKIAKTPVAYQLVSLFLNDQRLKRQAKQAERSVAPLQQAAVIGAGIMGGGIAYQAACQGIAMVMKDIQPHGLQQGLDEAAKLGAKQLERGKLSPATLAQLLNRIQPTLLYANIANAQLVVEAVVEQLSVKQQVLAEVEAAVGKQTLIATNTSTLLIADLAQALQHPQRFCGMHFFNPVHKMPLVEVIRGPQTSDATVTMVMACARQMGKIPVLVNDGPGFFVNRTLFPYFMAFNLLLQQGVDFQRMDRVMTKMGWPMGPAHLLDVVGLDTAVHAQKVMANSFPQRMQHDDHSSAIAVLQQAGRLGQKNAQGFYQHSQDAKGRWHKQADEQVYTLLQPLIQSSTENQAELSDDAIIERLMIPLCLEALRCIDEGIVASAADADIALVYGIGFPPFLGGALRYIDTLGLAVFVQQAQTYQSLGALYSLPDSLLERARQPNYCFYPQPAHA